jgi:hypothetical protein
MSSNAHKQVCHLSLYQEEELSSHYNIHEFEFAQDSTKLFLKVKIPFYCLTKMCEIILIHMSPIIDIIKLFIASINQM